MTLLIYLVLLKIADLYSIPMVMLGVFAWWGHLYMRYGNGSKSEK